MNAQFTIEALSDAHERKSFQSGNQRIDLYFQQIVSQDVRRGYATCYVGLDKATQRVAGFYTLSANAIPLTEVFAKLARRLPRYPHVPAALIGWLGVDLAFQGRRLAAMLVFDAISRVAQAPIGVFALFAHAIDENAASFYRHFGFIPFNTRPMTLFLPITEALAHLAD